MPEQPKPTGHKAKRLSLAPLTPDQALAAALRVRKEDVDTLAEQKDADKAKQAKKTK